MLALCDIREKVRDTRLEAEALWRHPPGSDRQLQDLPYLESTGISTWKEACSTSAREGASDIHISIVISPWIALDNNFTSFHHLYRLGRVCHYRQRQCGVAWQVRTLPSARSPD